MILFDTIMTIIEDFILSYFSFKILEINDKKGLIFLNAIICFIETFIFNNYITNNFLLLALLIMTNFVIIYFVKKELNLYYFIIPSILIALLLFSKTISFHFFFRSSLLISRSFQLNTRRLLIHELLRGDTHFHGLQE